jgi:hypothetical protein
MATSEPMFSQQDIETERQVVLLQNLIDGVVFDLSGQIQDVGQVGCEAEGKELAVGQQRERDALERRLAVQEPERTAAFDNTSNSMKVLSSCETSSKQKTFIGYMRFLHTQNGVA